MKGVAPPSKRELEENLNKRMFIPAGGRPGKKQKRFNRLGMPAAAQAAVAEDEDDDEPELSSLAKNKGLKAAAKKKGKGKGKGNANANAGSGNASGAAASATGLTPADNPTTANSLGLDIEYVCGEFREDGRGLLTP